MSLVRKIFDSGMGKMDELREHAETASRLSDQELLRGAKYASGLKRNAYWKEVKDRNLEAELAKMLKN